MKMLWDFGSGESTGRLVGAVFFSAALLFPQLTLAAAPPEKSPDELKALVAATFPPETKEFWTQAPELTEFGKQVEIGFAAEDFAALEQWAAEARGQTKPADDGGWKILIFHQHVQAPLDNGLSLAQRLEICRRWFAAKPDSIAARTALIRTQLQFAWQARGTGFANTITEEGAKSFAERLEPIRKWVAEADWAKVDDPYYFAGAIEFAKLAGGTAEQVDACMKAAAKCRQVVAEPFVTGAEYFLPRWHGSADDLTEYALNVYEATRAQAGAEMYAEIVNRVRCYHGSGTFKDFPFSWSLVVQGYCDHAKKMRNSLRLASELGMLAWYQGDRTAASVLVDHATNNYNRYVFRSGQEHLRFVGWAKRPLERIGKTIFELSGEVRGCVWDATGERIWFVDDQGLGGIELNDGTVRYLIPVSDAASIDQSSDGRYLAVGARGGLTVLVDLQQKKVEVLRKPDEDGEMLDLRFLADGKTLAGRRLSVKSYAMMWSIADGKQLADIHLSFFTTREDHSAFSPDGKLWFGHCFFVAKAPEVRRLATDSDTSESVRLSDPKKSPDGELDIQDPLSTRSLKVPPQAFPRANARVERFGAFSADSRLIAFSLESTLYLADLQSAAPFQQLKNASFEGFGLKSGVFSRDGKQLVVGLSRKLEYTPAGQPKPKLMELPSPIQVINVNDLSIAATLGSHEQGVDSVAISPDGTRIATSSGDGTIRIWEMPK